ncbi:MAG TPA: hypothetical protein VHP36_00920 [Chitinispirillaceae bacterium]|nr:hypothetical protein [Chitinispirillaceae bacterium]
MSENYDFNLIRGHLTALGYTENIDEGVYTFEHPEKVWIALNQDNNGIMLTTAFQGAKDYNPEDSTLLSILNMLNQETHAGSFVALDEYTVYKGWYFGQYSQQYFQNFFELWEEDVDLFLSGMEEDESDAE